MPHTSQKQNDYNYNARITPCGATTETNKWCCGANASECCSEWGKHEDSVNIPLTLHSSSTATDTPSAAASATLAGASSPTHIGLSVGAGAGIGVAATVVVLAVFAFILYLVWRRRQKLRHSNVMEPGQTLPDKTMSTKQQAPVEVSSERPTAELEGHRSQ